MGPSFRMTLVGTAHVGIVQGDGTLHGVHRLILHGVEFLTADQPILRQGEFRILVVPADTCLGAVVTT